MSDCSTCDDEGYHCEVNNCGHFDEDKNKWVKSISDNGHFCRKCSNYYCN